MDVILTPTAWKILQRCCRQLSENICSIQKDKEVAKKRQRNKTTGWENVLIQGNLKISKGVSKAFMNTPSEILATSFQKGYMLLQRWRIHLRKDFRDRNYSV